MAGVTTEMILDLALDVRARMIRVEARLGRIDDRLAGIDGHLAAVGRDLRGIGDILSRQDCRLARIERRLIPEAAE